MKLILGDCLEEMDKLIDEGVVVDLIVTDPPYGTTRNKWDSVIPLDEMWLRIKKLIKPNGAVILFGQDKFTARVMLSNEECHRYNLIWKKGDRTSGFLNANKMPLRNHEDIMVFYNQLPTYNPQYKDGAASHDRGYAYLYKENTNNNYGLFKPIEDTRKEKTKKFPKSVIDFDRPHPPIHPTQKPVELMEWLIKTYSNEGETVMDFTMGSGTTGIACRKLNRDFIGIEIDEEYFNIAKGRINAVI